MYVYLFMPSSNYLLYLCVYLSICMYIYIYIIYTEYIYIYYMYILFIYIYIQNIFLSKSPSMTQHRDWTSNVINTPPGSTYRASGCGSRTGACHVLLTNCNAAARTLQQTWSRADWNRLLLGSIWNRHTLNAEAHTSQISEKLLKQDVVWCGCNFSIFAPGKGPTSNCFCSWAATQQKFAMPSQ